MKTIKILIVASVLVLSSAAIFAQEHQHNNHSKTEIKKDTTKVEYIIREGKIDLKAIDKNKDGKVFQDQMDWNVISDKPGKCPLCKMTLKEVTLDETKKNLIKNGFKVK
ncbi:MAG: heavy metal-binding domain-containing protein [Melioribacteraceae bacterium]|nr:heavy metal-binding domain-containing protein [Melioribacteraceae bacterium]